MASHSVTLQLLHMNTSLYIFLLLNQVLRLCCFNHQSTIGQG